MPKKAPFQHRKKKLKLNRLKKTFTPSTSEVLPSGSLGSSVVSGPSDDIVSCSENELETISEEGSNCDNMSEPECVLSDIRLRVSLPSSWCDVSPVSLEKLVFVKLCTLGDTVKVTYTLTVKTDLTCSLIVANHEVNFNCLEALQPYAGPVNQEKLCVLLTILENLNVCCGQPDLHFVKMVLAKKGAILGQDGRVSAFVDNEIVMLSGMVYQRTVRTGDCDILCPAPGSKCSKCADYRANLRSLYCRWSKKHSNGPEVSSSSESSSKYANDRYLNTPEKLTKIHSLRKRAMNAKAQNTKLREKIRKITEKQSEIIDDDLNADLLGIMNGSKDVIEKSYPEGSFARLFWEEQFKANSMSNARQIRWHPVIIKWCLNLKLLSTSAYHALRTSGFIKLPSERTLYDYTHYFKTKAGFQDDVNSQLVEEIQKMEVNESRKFVGLLVDEMKIKEGLVYNKHLGQIIGFTNLEGIDQQLLQLEREDDHPSVATQVLTIMVRGLFFKMEFPYAHFGTTGATGEQLFSIIWKAIRLLEASGIKVIFVTSDGASTNRKMFRMHWDKKDPSTFFYKAKNPHTDDDRWVYFIADPPHLLKTVRNCWSHSGYSGTRLMKVRSDLGSNYRVAYRLLWVYDIFLL